MPSVPAASRLDERSSAALVGFLEKQPLPLLTTPSSSPEGVMLTNSDALHIFFETALLLQARLGGEHLPEPVPMGRDRGPPFCHVAWNNQQYKLDVLLCRSEWLESLCWACKAALHAAMALPAVVEDRSLLLCPSTLKSLSTAGLALSICLTLIDVLTIMSNSFGDKGTSGSNSGSWPACFVEAHIDLIFTVLKRTHTADIVSKAYVLSALSPYASSCAHAELTADMLLRDNACFAVEMALTLQSYHPQDLARTDGLGLPCIYKVMRQLLQRFNPTARGKIVCRMIKYGLLQYLLSSLELSQSATQMFEGVQGNAVLIL